jgi:hypothetical protein
MWIHMDELVTSTTRREDKNLLAIKSYASGESDDALVGILEIAQDRARAIGRIDSKEKVGLRSAIYGGRLTLIYHHDIA